MAGLVPAIHVFPYWKGLQGVDARDERGHDGGGEAEDKTWRKFGSPE